MDAPQKSNTNADDNRVVVRVSCFGCARCARRVCACVRVHRMLLALTGCFQCCARCVCAHLQNVCTRRNSVQHATDKTTTTEFVVRQQKKLFLSRSVLTKKKFRHTERTEKRFSRRTQEKSSDARVCTQKSGNFAHRKSGNFWPFLRRGKSATFCTGKTGENRQFWAPAGILINAYSGNFCHPRTSNAARGCPVVYHFCARDGNLVIFGQFSTILKFGQISSFLVNFGHVKFGHFWTVFVHTKCAHRHTHKLKN